MWTGRAVSQMLHALNFIRIEFILEWGTIATH